MSEYPCAHPPTATPEQDGVSETLKVETGAERARSADKEVS